MFNKTKMTGAGNNVQEFIGRLTKIVEANLQNEQFGVKELAREMGMSRSSLHRRVTEAVKISANQFICQVRLKKALKMLRETSLTISDTAYECGFHSATYFSKCFREYYGFPPGEVSNRIEPEPSAVNNLVQQKTNIWKKWLIPLASLIIFGLIIFIISESAYFSASGSVSEEKPITIAIMPLKFEGSDSMKIMAGGLTEAVLNSLMEIENLVIRSKTSVEQYRETTKSLKEIAKEMNVDYVIETSGRQYGDNLQVQINLADAENDIYLIREPYTANMKEENFLELQNYMVFDIIEKTKTQLSPREIELLEERMTDNKAALRFYLMGLQHWVHIQQKESFSNWDDILAEIFQSKKMFEKAIQLDSGFTAAYVNLGSILIDILYFPYSYDRPLSYAYLDSGLVLAEKALSLYNKREKDRNYRWALGLKSHYFYFKGNLEKARYYADEAGKIGPFDFEFYFARTFKYNLFEDYYQSIYCFLKYLELKPETEFIMPNIIRSAVNCFSKTGFPEMAEKYLLESLETSNDSLHYFSNMSEVSMWNGNFNSSISYDRKVLQLDSSMVYPLFRMAWCYVNLKDYTSAAECVKILEKSKMADNISLTIAFVHLKTGNQQKASELFEKEVKNRLEEIETRTLDAIQYKSHYLLACTYSAMGEKEKALHYIKEVNNRTTMPLMLIHILKEGPMFDNIRTEPEFIKLKKELENKYLKEHKRIAALLRQKGEI